MVVQLFEDVLAKIKKNFDHLSIAISASLLVLQLRKLYYIPAHWNNYMPMMEVGKIVGFDAIDFSQDNWRGIWTFIHLILTMWLVYTALTSSWEALALPHYLFTFWIIISCYRFGGFSLPVALGVNLGTLTVMQFAFKWKCRRVYRLFVSLPSLAELVIFCLCSVSWFIKCFLINRFV